MAGGANDARGVAERLLAVLDAFDQGGAGTLGLAEIAEHAGLAPSTAHRLLTRLVEWGGVEHVADGYRLGLKLWRLGTRHPGTRTLRHVALPYLEDLLQLTRQNVTVAVRDGIAALYLERLTARESVVVLADVGRRLPLHATGVGLVLLAWGGEPLLAEVLAAQPQRYLPSTVTEPEAIRRRLAEIRRSGVATTREEMTPGSASIAAPIRDGAGGVVAALSVIVSSGAPTDPRWELAVRLAAAGISRALAGGERTPTE